MSKQQDKINKEALIKLIIKDSALDELSRKAKEINMYKVFRIETAENRHSNMFAWLLDPYENHYVGDIFLREIIKCIFESCMNDIKEDEKEQLAEEIASWTIGDFDNVHVEREARTSANNKNRADIIVSAEKGSESFLLVIENKINASESVGQTKTYRKQMEKRHEKFKRFVFLTPGGEPAEDDTWIKLSYKNVVDSLKTVMQMDNIPDKTKWIIDDSIKTIERNILGDESLTAMCDRICDNHPDAIGLLLKALKNYNKGKECYKNDEDINNMLKGILTQHLEAITLLGNNKTDKGLLVAKCIREVLRETNETKKDYLELTDNLINKKAYIKFNTKKMTELLGGELKHDASPWKTKQKYYY